MATNPTNSTAINIRNLPVSQLAVSTDSLILQTTNGTQTIPFANFNVVKTDINGNATVTGTLTGGDAIFTGGVRITSLSASSIWASGSNSGYGVSLPYNYYDSFTIQNGLIVSASQTSNDYINNPIYSSLFTQLTTTSANITSTTQTQIQALTSIQSNTLTTSLTTITASNQIQIQTLSAATQTQLQTLSGIYGAQIQQLTASNFIYDGFVSTSIAAGNLSGLISYTNFFANGYPTAFIPLASITPQKFNIMLNYSTQGVSLTTTPYIASASIANVSNNLQAALCIGATQSTPLYFNVRLLVTA